MRDVIVSCALEPVACRAGGACAP